MEMIIGGLLVLVGVITGAAIANVKNEKEAE